MSGKSKNKRGNQHIYVDRNVVLRESNRLPNVAVGIRASPCIGNEKNGSLERHFKHKLSDLRDDSPMLTAMVLNNDICVLVLESGGEGIASVSFKVEADISTISGKKKKGAKKIKAGSPVVTLKFTDGTEKEYYTPIGGQLLETNLNLIIQPKLMFDQPCGTGFIAVIYPDTEIPSLTNQLSDKVSADMDRKSNLCFAYIKGLCKRGDSCKFMHDGGPAAKKRKTDSEDCTTLVEDSVTHIISDPLSDKPIHIDIDAKADR